MAVSTTTSLLSAWNLDPHARPAVPQVYQRTFTISPSTFPTALTAEILTAKSTCVKLAFYPTVFGGSSGGIFVDAELTPPPSLSGGRDLVGQEGIWTVTPETVPSMKRPQQSSGNSNTKEFRVVMVVTRGELGKVLGEIEVGEC